MKRRTLALLCLLALAVGGLALGQQARLSAGAALANKVDTSKLPRAGANSPSDQSAKKKDGDPTQLPPDFVIYDMMFRQLGALKKKADQVESRGGDGASLRTYLKDEAKLDEKLDKELNKIQSEYERVVAKMDAKARKIIEGAREKHKHGRLQEGEALPPPPEELKSLQQRRNNLTMQAREHLRQAFGDEGFQKFDEFVKRHIGSRIKPVEAVNGRPATLGENAGGK
jgi:hypothetical protein